MTIHGDPSPGTHYAEMLEHFNEGSVGTSGSGDMLEFLDIVTGATRGLYRRWTEGNVVARSFRTVTRAATDSIPLAELRASRATTPAAGSSGRRTGTDAQSQTARSSSPVPKPSKQHSTSRSPKKHGVSSSKARRT